MEDGTPSPAAGAFDEDYERINEIRVVAQALAFRGAQRTDARELETLINAAYRGEMAGQPEGFRQSPVVDGAMIRAMIADSDCKWVIAETPNGQDAVEDGTILGACCFSVGSAASNNTLEKVGAIRLLAVLPSFVGLCVGRRVLQRAEEAIRSDECVRCLCCVPELRVSVRQWLERRSYDPISTAQFPDELCRSFSRPTELVVLSKSFIRKRAGSPSSGSEASSGRRGSSEFEEVGIDDDRGEEDLGTRDYSSSCGGKGVEVRRSGDSGVESGNRRSESSNNQTSPLPPSSPSSTSSGTGATRAAASSVPSTAPAEPARATPVDQVD